MHKFIDAIFVLLIGPSRLDFLVRIAADIPCDLLGVTGCGVWNFNAPDHQPKAPKLCPLSRACRRDYRQAERERDPW